MTYTCTYFKTETYVPQNLISSIQYGGISIFRPWGINTFQHKNQTRKIIKIHIKILYNFLCQNVLIFPVHISEIFSNIRDIITENYTQRLVIIFVLNCFKYF